MQRAPHHLRSAAIAVATAVSLSTLAPSQLKAQTAGYRAEVVRIDPSDRQLTLKASMGQLTVRVLPSVALDDAKAGDRVLITFGQDGTETVITRIEPVRP